ncbi:MAG TPA: glycosyltransferase family 39 protein [Candidatus Sulfotelmatobacter sp.]|nr:glycosyltransferase family 39 protein [Candidatus Sulfotelmatobacter sp.]
MLKKLCFAGSLSTSQPAIPSELPQTGLDTRRDGRRFLLWVILAALAIRLIVVAFVFESYLDPGRNHWEFGYEGGQVAGSIVQGHGFGNLFRVPSGPTASMGPIMPYLLAGVMKLFGLYSKASAIAILSLNSLLSALTCLPIFFVAKQTFGARVAQWSSWGWAFYPYAINFSANSMWDHALMGLLVTLIFWISYSMDEKRGLWAWAGFGFLWGVAGLTNAVVFGVLPFLGGWIWYRLLKKKARWLLPAATAGLALLVTISPWMIRNIRTFHQPVFLKNNYWLAILSGNVGDTLHWLGNASPGRDSAEMAEYLRVGEIQYMAEKKVEAIQFIKQNTGLFVWRSIRRFVFMWTGFWSLNPEYLKMEPFDIPNIPLCTAITIFAILGLCRAFRSNVETAIPYAIMLIVFPLGYYPTHPELSYRQSWDPEIVILVCYALTGLRRFSPR